MTALPVAFYLKDLSGEQPRAWRDLAGNAAEAKADREFEVSEAHARGVVEGRSAAQVEFDSVAATQAVAFEQRLATERETWVAEEGERLARMIDGGLDDIEQRVSDLVSEVLKSFVSESVRSKAVGELGDALKSMLSKGEYAKVVVSGPADLIAEVKSRLGDGTAGVSFVEADGIDVVVNADDTVLATRIGAWVAAIGDGTA